jgi:acyl-homoserine-lactone acylase
VLDGSRSACDLGTDPDAAVPGILGPKNLPVLFRTDHVSNMNDSHWLANPAAPLSGFARIVGDENAQRSLRTRLGILKIDQRLAGTDGLAGNRFTTETLWQSMFDNRVHGGELLRDQLVAACRHDAVGDGDQRPPGPDGRLRRARRLGPQGRPGTARGAHVFREFVLAAGAPYADAFCAGRPGHHAAHARWQPTRACCGHWPTACCGSRASRSTPRWGPSRRAARRRRRSRSTADRGETGTFNVITDGPGSGVGTRKVTHGASYVMALELGRAARRAADPHLLAVGPTEVAALADQNGCTQRGWDTIKYTDAQIEADPALRTYLVTEDEDTGRRNGWRALAQLGFTSQGQCVAYFQRAARSTRTARLGAPV